MSGAQIGSVGIYIYNSLNNSNIKGIVDGKYN